MFQSGSGTDRSIIEVRDTDSACRLADHSSRRDTEHFDCVRLSDAHNARLSHQFCYLGHPPSGWDTYSKRSRKKAMRRRMKMDEWTRPFGLSKNGV
jgi:hypothetical protein